jgi:hypothetical protein
VLTFMYVCSRFRFFKMELRRSTKFERSLS